MARLFADENFPLAVVEALRGLGHEVETALDAGRANRGIRDADVLAYAHGEVRAVLTLNRRHFVRLHLEGRAHSGIVVCTRDDDFLALALRIHSALATLPNLTGQVVRISRPPNP